MGWMRRLRDTLAGGRRPAAFEEEAAFHLEQRSAELIAAGMTPGEARLEARRRFGNLTLTRERTHDADTLPWLRDVGRDLRYAARQLRLAPGFAVGTVAMLAIGLGANTAIFGVVDALLLRPLPVAAPHELVLLNWLEGRKEMRRGMDGVRTTDEGTGRSTSTSFLYPTFERLRNTDGPLAELFAFYPVDQLNVVAGGSAEIASGQFVSGNYFRGLGVEAIVGRTLTDADDRAGAAQVATLTHRYWTRRFGADRAIVGRSVLINRVAFTVVGVTPPGFAGTLDVTDTPDVTVPFAAEPLLQPGGPGHVSDLHRPAFLWVRLMGRLSPGATAAQAAAALDTPMRRAMLDEWQQSVAVDPPESGDPRRTLDDAPTLRAEPGAQGLMFARRGYARPLWMLLACTGLVLLVTCANLANLLLSRGAARHREIATRLALGAARGRLVRQLLTEGLLVSVLGAAGGLALAWWGIGLLGVWGPWGGSVSMDGALGWRVLAFGAGLAVATCVLFGLVPALRITRRDLSLVARRAIGSSSALIRGLVIAQVAVSLVLLVAAALFVGTLRNLGAVDTGFNADQLLLFRIQPQLNGYDQGAGAELYARLIERLEAIPGVRSATVSRHGLLGFSRRSTSLVIEGAPAAADADTEVNIVDPGFFATMEIPLVLGRGFSATRDTAAAPRVAVVNQRFATTFFGTANPIGRSFRFGSAGASPVIEIVGVSRDAKYTDLRSVTQPVAYVPLRQDVPGQASVAVRTSGDPLAVAPAVREAVRRLDATLPIFALTSQREQADASTARERMFARLSASLGAIALLLVAVGIYGALSYAVARRTAEIGVRIAIGAPRSTVIGMVLGDAMITAAAGVAIGLPAAAGAVWAARSVLADLLFGLEPGDPIAFAGAAALLVTVGFLAAFLPARRASRVDPIVALRAD